MLNQKYRFYFVVGLLGVLLTACSAPNHYAHDTMRNYYDKDYALFCGPDDPKCFGDSDTSDYITHNYNFQAGFPYYENDKSYFQRFSAEGTGYIERLESSNSLWIAPFEGGKSRIIRFTEHYQNALSSPDGAFRLSLLGTQPLGSDTPKLYRKSINNLRQLLLNKRVRYRCYGILNSKQADCFVLVNEDLDLGAWMIKNGFLSPLGDVPETYTSASKYSTKHEIGFNSEASIREQVVFPEFRKDRYGVCHHVSKLPSDKLDIFYSSYPTMDECLLAGGIQ